MNYLLVRDMNADEELRKIDVETVTSISTANGVTVRRHIGHEMADENKRYIEIKIKGDTEVAYYEAEKTYICFECKGDKKNYLVAKDMDDEEVERIELDVVRNISVIDGAKVNVFSVWYGFVADKSKDYIIVQFNTEDNDIGFMPCEVTELYICFE